MNIERLVDMVNDIANFFHSEPDHALAVVNSADSSDDARARRLVPVHACGREGGELEKWRSVIQQPIDSLPGQKLSALLVLGNRLVSASL